jgi:putative MATE family efflux protein
VQQKLTLGGLAWPIFVENFLTRALGMANIFLLSRYSESAVAAIGVSNQLVNFITMLFSFVTLGTAVVMSQNLGAGNRERAASASSIAVMLNTGLGLATGMAVLLLHRPILTLMGLSGRVMEYTSVYFCIVGGFCALQGFNLSMATILRNYGLTRLPMAVFLGMNLLNLTGNSIVVLRPFGLPDLGIAGIAGFTVFSQAMACVAMVICAKKCKIRLRLEKPFPKSVLKDILRIGIPGAGDSIAYNIMQICQTGFVATMGTTALATLTYALNYTSIVQLMGFAVGQSSQILVGRRVGRGDYEGAYRLAFRSTWLAMALNISVMAAVMIFQRPLLHLFTLNEEILSVVFWCFVVDLVLEFGRPFNLVIGTCIRGAGDVRWAVIASVSSLLLVCIPLGYLFTQVFHLGVPGVFMALCADEWLRGQLMAWRWRSRRWERAALVKETASELPD